MKPLSRRKLITTGLAAAAGASGLATADVLAKRYGLIPPDAAGPYGVGETLTYAAQRIMTSHSMAREFSPSQISNPPFANEVDPLGGTFKRLWDGGFADWRLTVDGMVARPAVFSLADLKSHPPTGRMVIHTFAFRWKPSVTDNQKQHAIQEIRALQGQIPGLLETSVGVNISPRSQGYELGGVNQRIAALYEGNATAEVLNGMGHWLIGEPGWEHLAERALEWLETV